MKTAVRRWAYAAVVAGAMLAGTMAFAPPASAHGGISCGSVTYNDSNAYVTCSGHGSVRLSGVCDVVYPVSDIDYATHSTVFLSISCPSEGRLQHVSVQLYPVPN